MNWRVRCSCRDDNVPMLSLTVGVTVSGSVSVRLCPPAIAVRLSQFWLVQLLLEIVRDAAASEQTLMIDISLQLQLKHHTLVVMCRTLVLATSDTVLCGSCSDFFCEMCLQQNHGHLDFPWKTPREIENK
uniref:Uncharacterized protein n=1 Tax=Arundo donax TaxID=35708 RepID=A0A0A9E9K3_ARUDO